MRLSARGILLLGAAIGGLLMAAFEAVLFKPVPPNVAALVNGVVISRADYQQALGFLSKARRGPLDETDRKQVLDRLIENELLLQHAQELDFIRHHAGLRHKMIQAMINFILEDAQTPPPNEDVLRDFYQQHQIWFRPSERLHVQNIYLRSGQTARAQAIKAALEKGEPFTKLIAQGDSDILNAPDILLPSESLSQYLGKDLTQKAQQMKIGEIIGPIETSTGIYFLYLRDRKKAHKRSFEAIKDQVAHRYQMVQDQKKLDDYIKNLRNQADLRVIP